jgi:hypothetical protein
MTPQPIPKQVDLPATTRGDYWFGIARIGPLTINGDTPEGELERVRLHFVSSTGVVYRLDSEPGADAPIIIDDAVDWEARIPPVAEFIQTAGRYSFDVEFWQSGRGAPLTLYRGTIEIKPDITR